MQRRVSPSKSWLINKGCEAAGGGRVDATEQEIVLVSVGLSLTLQELFVVSKTKSHEPQVSHRRRQIHCKSTGSTRTRSYSYTNISHVISIIQSRETAAHPHSFHREGEDQPGTTVSKALKAEALAVCSSASF